jgi:YopX protein.
MFDLYRGQQIGTGVWLYGDLIHLDNSPLVVPYLQDRKFNKRTLPTLSVVPETVGRNSQQNDVEINQIFEQDIIQSVFNPTIYFIIKYGQHPAFCSLDHEWEVNMGFYAENRYGQFPIGLTGQWAKVVGNIIDNPELSKLL